MISEESRRRYSQAMKLRHSQIDPAIRRQRMSICAKRRWSLTSAEDRRAHAMKMVKARKNYVQDKEGSQGRDLPGPTEPSGGSESGCTVNTGGESITTVAGV